MPASYNRLRRFRRGVPMVVRALSALLLTDSALSATPRVPVTVENDRPISRTDYFNVTARRPGDSHSADASDLLTGQLGYSSYAAGGVANLPVLNGMADDRVATIVDGMRMGDGCPNHMNPIMSYVDPDSVSVARAIAGITSVSEGGDSIGGSVLIKRRPLEFSKTHSVLVTGRARGDYRSNGGGSGASGSVTVANDVWSLRYTGSYAHASDYVTGGVGRRVRSTSYLSFNHAVTAGFQKGAHAADLTFGQQDIPYEGFPNAYMDMTNNRSSFVNGHYKGAFDWGTLEARGFWQRVNHVMNMLADKGGHSATTGMPMNIDKRTVGYSVDVTIPLSTRHRLMMGSQFFHDGLNDWWPPLMGSKMMGPGTFHSINNGHRDRVGHYLSWNAQWTPKLSSQLGVRNDVVMMNTGNVAPYSWIGMMSRPDANAARAFNALKRGRTDVNFDVTATTRYVANDRVSLEGGFARKTRSPNMYERYAWGMGAMATKMIGWFGDGNGYVGNPDLKPEVAYTASYTLSLHDASQRKWAVNIQPFYTYTHHYINVTRIAALGKGFEKLRFVNHNAQSYGVNANGRVRLYDSRIWGSGAVVSYLNWVRGQDEVTGSGLYHQMPASGSVGFHATYKDLSGRVDVTLVKRKSTVDWLRNEPRTPGYALLGLGLHYNWRAFTLDAAIENLLNQKYYLPLGGWSLGDYKATKTLSPLPGMGRSFNLSLAARF